MSRFAARGPSLARSIACTTLASLAHSLASIAAVVALMAAALWASASIAPMPQGVSQYSASSTGRGASSVLIQRAAVRVETPIERANAAAEGLPIAPSRADRGGQLRVGSLLSITAASSRDHACINRQNAGCGSDQAAQGSTQAIRHNIHRGVVFTPLGMRSGHGVGAAADAHTGHHGSRCSAAQPLTDGCPNRPGGVVNSTFLPQVHEHHSRVESGQHGGPNRQIFPHRIPAVPVTAYLRLADPEQLCCRVIAGDRIAPFYGIQEFNCVHISALRNVTGELCHVPTAYTIVTHCLNVTRFLCIMALSGAPSTSFFSPSGPVAPAAPLTQTGRYGVAVDTLNQDRDSGELPVFLRLDYDHAQALALLTCRHTRAKLAQVRITRTADEQRAVGLMLTDVQRQLIAAGVDLPRGL